MASFKSVVLVEVSVHTRAETIQMRVVLEPFFSLYFLEYLMSSYIYKVIK
jgi:hypothetical protein